MRCGSPQFVGLLAELPFTRHVGGDVCNLDHAGGRRIITQGNDVDQLLQAFITLAIGIGLVERQNCAMQCW